MPAPYPIETVDRVAVLAGEGRTSTQIAAEVGMSADNVRKLCQRYSIKLSRVPANKLEARDPSIVDRVRAAIKAGKRADDICEAFGFSKYALARMIEEHALPDPRKIAAKVIGKKQLLSRMARGLSTREIAEELKTTRDRVAKAQRRYGLYYTPEQREMVRRRAGKMNPNCGGPYRGHIECSASDVLSISHADRLDRRAIAEASAKLRDAVLALYRRERERKAA